jgi:hypothetical protein
LRGPASIWPLAAKYYKPHTKLQNVNLSKYLPRPNSGSRLLFTHDINVFSTNPSTGVYVLRAPITRRIPQNGH